MQYSKPFTKLFSSIITSSIWNEDDKTRVVWITLLALADANGIVCASVGGLAHAARVSKGDCEVALGHLCMPDDDSRSSEFEGRRIDPHEDGFLILNYKKYRDLGRKIDRNEYLADKQWEHRQKRKQTSTNVNNESTPVNKASTNASASASFLEECKRNLFYAGIDIDREFEKAQRWCKRKNRRCTQRFFENWLGKADREIVAPKPKPVPEAPKAPTVSEEELKQKREELGKEVRKLREQFRMP